jgi:hypothetical protein
MKNVLLKILGMFILSVGIISCNNDDDSTMPMEEVDFFPLKVGNYWVYHHYIKQNTEDFVFGNRVDTVKITGIIPIDNQDYFVMETNGYQFSSGDIIESKIENVRINSSGHLVKDNGSVLHPGDDMNYTHQVSYNQYQPPFVIEYRLHPVENWTFNGQNYQIAPYRGMARAEDIQNHPYLDGKKVEYSYLKGIGKVLEHTSAVENPFFYEYRLVDYHLN